MDNGIQLTTENPKNKANIFSKLCFTWMIKLFRKGLKDGLAVTDIYKTLDCDISDRACGRLETNWNKELKKAKEKSVEPSLVFAIIRTFFWEYMFYGILQFIQYVFVRSSQPIVLAYLIQLFAQDRKDEEFLTGRMYIYGAVIVILSIINIFLFHHITLGQVHIGMRVRVAMSSLVYRKMLRLNKKSLSRTPAGQIVNLLSNDVSRFDLVSFTLHFLWIAPFQIAVVTYFIWDQVGISSLAGILTMVLLTIPLQGFLGKVMAKIRTRTAARTDKRVKLMNEIISGIQVIKMYAWEKPFEKMVESLRIHEIKSLTIAGYIRGFLLSCMVFIERTTLYLTLITYTLLGNVITADKVFSMSQFYNLLQLALAIFLPCTFSYGAETLVACKRLKKFLLLEEIEESPVKVVKNDTIAITGVNATWPGDVDQITLNGINIEIPSGKLCVIIGPVGAGKSSLLQLLLGELAPTKGHVSVHGNISYASQEPWLFAATVRNNILFGKEYNKELYNKVIKVCALAQDLKQFPNGDKTIVGERGVSLSGGQRARINLARAVYRNADIYMLDDPLSAVDTHVGKHLFEQCILKYLRDKTRILVTHQLQFLKRADIIIALNKGKVEIMGSYDELAKSDIDITKLMVAADETTEEEKLKRHVSRQKSVLSTHTIQSVEDEGIINIDENEEEVGLKGKSAYTEYFFAAGNICVLLTVALIILLGQICASGADFWVTIWTDQENLKMIPETEIVLNHPINPMNNFTYSKSTSGDYYHYKSDSSTSGNTPMDTLTSIYIYTAIIVALILFTILRSISFFKITMMASKNLHSQMFHSLLKAKMRFFDINPSGRILNRFSKDIGVVDEVLPRAMMETIQIMLVMISILVMVAITNYYLVIAILFFGIFFMVLRRWFLITAKIMKHLEGTSKSPVFSHLNSSLNGISTIRVCKAEEQLIQEFDHHQDINTSAWYLTIACTASFGLWLDMIAVLFTAVVVFSFIGIHQLNGVSGSIVGLAISQSLILTGMLQYGVRQSAEVLNQMISVERILQYTTLDEEGPFDGPQHKDWPSDGNITFRHMDLKYSENELPVLCDLNLHIKSGEKIGIVGRTGAGKSSLISSVFRLAILEGSIEIDTVDTKTVCLSELRRKISIIPQEPVLFSASLRYNLDPFNEFQDTMLWDALEEVELKDIVSSLDFIVDEGGGNFSLGQRQLVCLARAILRNNKILVLDEATANVDLKTDELIQQTIRRKFTNCTVLTIAHRLNTIMDSDKVLVMDKGSVAEFDHPHLLLQRETGIFTGMVRQTGPQMTKKLSQIAEESFNDKYKRTTL